MSREKRQSGWWDRAMRWVDDAVNGPERRKRAELIKHANRSEGSKKAWRTRKARTAEPHP